CSQSPQSGEEPFLGPQGAATPGRLHGRAGLTATGTTPGKNTPARSDGSTLHRDAAPVSISACPQSPGRRILPVPASPCATGWPATNASSSSPAPAAARSRASPTTATATASG